MSTCGGSRQIDVGRFIKDMDNGFVIFPLPKACRLGFIYNFFVVIFPLPPKSGRLL